MTNVELVRTLMADDKRSDLRHAYNYDVLFHTAVHMIMEIPDDEAVVDVLLSGMAKLAEELAVYKDKLIECEKRRITPTYGGEHQRGVLMSDRRVLQNLLDDFFHEVLDRLEERKVDLLRWIAIGRRVEEDCTLFGNSAWMRRADGEIERVDMAKLKMVEIPNEPMAFGRDPAKVQRDLDEWVDPPYRELTDAEEQAEERTWD